MFLDSSANIPSVYINISLTTCTTDEYSKKHLFNGSTAATLHTSKMLYMYEFV